MEVSNANDLNSQFSDEDSGQFGIFIIVAI